MPIHFFSKTLERQHKAVVLEHVLCSQTAQVQILPEDL